MIKGHAGIMSNGYTALVMGRHFGKRLTTCVFDHGMLQFGVAVGRIEDQASPMAFIGTGPCKYNGFIGRSEGFKTHLIPETPPDRAKLRSGPAIFYNGPGRRHNPHSYRRGSPNHKSNRPPLWQEGLQRDGRRSPGPNPGGAASCPAPPPQGSATCSFGKVRHAGCRAQWLLFLLSGRKGATSKTDSEK